jgi:hypothetical protein
VRSAARRVSNQEGTQAERAAPLRDGGFAASSG